MELRKRLDLACKYREESRGCSNEKESKLLLDDAIELLTPELIKNIENSELLCLLGLCWYDYPEESKTRNEKVSGYLKRSLEIDCNNEMALLYLGYHYFDTCKYSDSLEMFNRFNGLVSSEERSLWLDVKFKELLFCCNVYLGHSDENVFDLFLSVLIGYESLKVEDLPIPREIVKCLCSTECVLVSDEYKRRLMAVFERLGVDDLFKEEIGKIREVYPK